jgi:hypothetical protein
MIHVLEASVKLNRNELFKYPLAVVVTKTDAFDLDSIIGHSAAKQRMEQYPTIKLEIEAINMLVQEFLIEYGLGNFVRDVHLQFENVHFFSCSALGRMPDPNNHSSFEPFGVLDPIVWLLGKIKVVNYIQERSLTMDKEDWKVASSKNNFFEKAKYYFVDSLLPRSEKH